MTPCNLVMFSLFDNIEGTWKRQAPVVERLDSAIQQTNHYPFDNYYQNQLSYQPIYSMDRTMVPNLFIGKRSLLLLVVSTKCLFWLYL